MQSHENLLKRLVLQPQTNWLTGYRFSWCYVDDFDEFDYKKLHKSFYLVFIFMIRGHFSPIMLGSFALGPIYTSMVRKPCSGLIYLIPVDKTF